VPDFKAYAAARLRLDALTGARAAELVDEVARQLSDAHAEALAAGATPEQAFGAALAHVPDWEAFSRELVASERLPLESRLESPARSRLGRLAADLAADLLHGARMLGKHRVFSVVTIVTLALGIGANTALFSLADAVLLRTLPVREPERLRMLEWTARRTGFYRSYDGSSSTNAAGERVARSISYPAYERLRDHASSFASLSAYTGAQLNLSLRGGAGLAVGVIASGDYFDTLGVNALLGTTFTPEDERAGARVAVLSHGAWTRLFGSDVTILGQSVFVNGEAVVVRGVLPRGVCGPNPAFCPDLFLPMAPPGTYAGADIRRPADRWAFPTFGRLKPGVSDEQARAEVERLLRQAVLDAKPAREYDLPRVALLPGAQGLGDLRGDLLPTLKLLGWAVAAVLLTTCANVAGLLLVRATARRREIATRLALGASRGRLVRQLLAESLLLSSLGAAAGLLLASAMGGTLTRALLAADRPLGVAPALDLRALAFSFALCLLAGLLFGVVPALRASAVDPAPALTASRAASGAASFRAGKALITLQVALALVLVVGSALFVRSLLRLQSEDLGFRPEGLLVFQLNPTLNGYQGERVLDFHQRVLEQLQAVPGVRAASMSRWGILSGSRTSDGINAPGGRGIGVNVHYVAPRFFETMGFPMRAGRDIAATDREAAPRVVVINEAAAKRLLPGVAPVGQELRFNDAPVQVVGLVADTRYESLRRPAPPTVYVPFRQNVQFSMTYVVRCEDDPLRLAPALQRAAASVDPNVPAYELKTQLDQIATALRRERLFASLISGFALLTLVLAGLGVYGTLAYLVARRTAEIGVRVALGARRADIVRLVLSEASAPVLLGIAIGLWTSVAAAGLVRSMLFQLVPQDTAAFVTAAAVLIATALVASWLPARRAARVAPVDALRCD
jgi:predicted permease